MAKCLVSPLISRMKIEGTKLLCMIALVVLVATANGIPNCIAHNNIEVVCTGGNSDFILRRGLVSDNNRTVRITLKKCRITDLDFEAFENDDNLEYIDLSENKISELKLGVLDGNRHVTHLNLSYNKLSTFPLGLFDEKVNIKVLDLSNNKLNLLKLGIFDTLENLTHLDLSSNALLGRAMDAYIFDKSTKIKIVDFSRNDMSGSPENLLQAFLALEFLNLDRCSLKEVPYFATSSNLRTMKHLKLSYNHITKIEQSRTFMNLDNLDILNLAHNEIERITDGVFTSLRRLRILVLRGNRLKNLPGDLCYNMNKLGNLDLSLNFIEYVPLNAFRGSGLKNLNLSNNRFTYLDSNFCLELRNSGVQLNKFFFNDNPWQCACLNDILKETKTYNIEYNSVKYDGQQPVCVTKKTFTCKRQLADNEIFLQIYDSEN